jgi:hypothetical protein
MKVTVKKISRIRRREEMLQESSAPPYVIPELTYCCRKMENPGIVTRLNPQNDILHFFGGVFQNVVESVLESDETDLKDQLLFDVFNEEAERIGMYGSALLLNDRKPRSDIVGVFMFEVQRPDLEIGPSISTKRRSKVNTKIESNCHHIPNCSRTCLEKRCPFFWCEVEYYYKDHTTPTHVCSSKRPSFRTLTTPQMLPERHRK